MKTRKIISSILLMVLLSCQMVFAKDYSDYPQKFWDVPKNHWAFEQVSELVDKGVIEGYQDGSFKPDKTVSRAEWAKMMCVSAGIAPCQMPDLTVPYLDIDYASWYNEYIMAVKQYMNYYDYNGEQYFLPDQAACREDVTVSMVRLKGYDINDVDYSVLNQFKDVDSISNDLKKYVSVAISKGLITGFTDKTFRGQDTLTRAEAATILQRAFEMGNDNKLVDNKDNTNSSSGNEIGVTNPTSTPKPTKKPVETSKPKSTKTPEPTRSPEPTETPEPAKEPEVTKKPYKIETLSKATITPFNNSYSYKAFYTQDNSDNLFYYDNVTHDIVKINMITREKVILANSDSLTIRYEDLEYNNMKIKGIFYDTYVNSLVVYGSFSGGDNSFEHRPEPFNCIVELETMNVITFKDIYLGNAGDSQVFHSIADYTFYGVLNNGDYVVNKCTQSYFHDYVISRETYNRRALGGRYSDFYAPFQEYNDEIYYVGFMSYGGGLYKLTKNKNESESDKRISDMPFCGIKNDKAYALVDNAIGIFTLDGQHIKAIPFDDIELKDNKRFESSNINHVLLASSNDDIVFYDLWTNSFRIISEN